MRRMFRPIAVLILVLGAVLLEAWALGRIPTYVQIGKFLDAISPVVTAIASGVIAWFTATIWIINRRQLAHARRVDRAYVNGGWGRYEDGKLYANINNDGKTPATVHHMAMAILPLAGLPSTPLRCPEPLLITISNLTKESSFRITCSSHGTDCMNLNEFCMGAFGTQTFSERNMKAGFSFMSGHAGPLLQVSPNIGDGHKTAPAPWVPWDRR